VNARFVCDGQEEIGGTAIVDHLADHAGDAAACVIFDTPKLDDDTHVFTIATRGTLLRSGGSLPLMPMLERLRIPAIVAGFAVPSSNMHAPNERMRVTDLEDGLTAARATLTALGELSP
jgi:acetylornithine deacetylase/succinyl-diaminopimelate desuccinylase-like protein